jgi:hypothetical protein
LSLPRERTNLGTFSLKKLTNHTSSVPLCAPRSQPEQEVVLHQHSGAPWGAFVAGTRAQNASIVTCYTPSTTALMSCRPPSSLTWLTFFTIAVAVHGYTFNITSGVKQCENIDIEIVGSGSPPYSVVIIPYGPSPLPNGIEARKIVEQNWTDSSTSLSFQLQYPAYSQFIAIVSIYHSST